jgi:hypothetical protein
LAGVRLFRAGRGAERLDLEATIEEVRHECRRCKGSGYRGALRSFRLSVDQPGTAVLCENLQGYRGFFEVAIGCTCVERSNASSGIMINAEIGLCKHLVEKNYRPSGAEPAV